MSYTPINWQTGDTITAEKMNKMDNGWGVESTQLFSETVTTEIDPEFPDDPPIGFVSAQVVLNSTITVNFDGVDYVCNNMSQSPSMYGDYGAQWVGNTIDFSVYPFLISSAEGDGTALFTENTGTYLIAVSTASLQTTEDFSEAVKKCVDLSSLPLLCVSGVTTYEEMAQIDVATQNKIMFFWADNDCFIITSVSYNGVDFIPKSSYVTAGFVDNVFTVTVS